MEESGSGRRDYFWGGWVFYKGSCAFVGFVGFEILKNV